MAKNKAVESVAAAINDPAGHTPPPGEGSTATVPAVPDPTPGTQSNANPAGQPAAAPAPTQDPIPQAPPVDGSAPPAQPQDQPPAQPPAPADPNAVTLQSATLEQIVARTKELAGEDGVDGNSVLAANMNERLANARQQEKSKLYNQIDGLKGDLTAAQEVNQKQAETIKNLSAQKPGDTPPAKPDGDGDGDDQPQGFTAEQVDAAITAGLSKMQESYEKQQAELRAQIQALQDSANQESLDAYKSRLIEENQGKIIEELVQGNTKEELDNSLVQATQAFARYATNITQDGQAAAAAAPSVPPAPTLNPQPSTPAPVAGAPISVPGTMEEFGNNRSDILAKASQAAKEAISQLGPS